MDPRLFQNEMSEAQQALYDNFVNEYLKDFDEYAAALRVGFLPAFAAEQSLQLMGNSYVRRRIVELTRISDEKTKETDRALLENTLREAMQQGSYASRVAAAKVFAEMNGWSKPDTSAANEQAIIAAFQALADKVPV